MNISDRDKKPADDGLEQETDSSAETGKTYCADVSHSNVTPLSPSMRDGLDALSALADKASGPEPADNVPAGGPDEDQALRNMVHPADDSIYELLLKLKGDIDSLKREQVVQLLPPNERHMYRLLAELKRDIDSIKSEQAPAAANENSLQTMLFELRRDIEEIKHEQAMVNASGGEGQLYGMLSDLRRDIEMLKQEQTMPVSTPLTLENELAGMLAELKRDINDLQVQQYATLQRGGAGSRLLPGLNFRTLTTGFAVGLGVMVAAVGGLWLASPGLMTPSNSGEQVVQKAVTPAAPIAGNVSGMAGAPVSLKIDTSKLIAAPGTVVRISGMPEIAALSSGIRKADAWLIPANQIKGLKLQVPANYSGSVSARLEVIDKAGKIVQSDTFQVAFLAKTVQPRPRPATGEAQAPKQTVVRTRPLRVVAPKLASAEEKELIANANSLLDRGDIIGARRVLDYAVTRGSVAAAVTLAKTYDPQLVDELDALFGVQPNITRAKVLYHFAARKGNKEAAKRLAEIGE